MRYSRKCSGSTPSASARRRDHVVRGHGAVAVDEVVQVAGRELRLRGQAAVASPQSRPSAARSSGPNGFVAETPRAGAGSREQLRDRLRLAGVTRRSSPPARGADVDRAVLERLLPDRDPQRAADQVGVGELLARRAASRSSSSTSSRRRERLQRSPRPLRPAPPPPCSATTCDVVGRDRPRPDDPVLVVVLLDRGRHHAAGPIP